MSDSSHLASGGGRSRGRARARGSDGQVSVPSLRRPGLGDAPTAGRGRGVSVERPGHASTDQAAAPREPIAGRAYHPQQNNLERPGPVGRAPPGQAGGRASHRGGPSGGQTRPPGQEGMSGVTEAMAKVHVASPPASAHVGSGHSSVQGSSQPSVGRGTSRGGRERNVSILRTRPTALENKQGKGGKPCNLMANFFALTGKTDWRLMQYRVDFKPEEDQTFIRKMLLRDQQPNLPKYMFDGTLLYTTTRLTADKVPLVLNSKRKSDGQVMEITIKEVGELHPNDYQYLSFFNMVLRQCLEKLNLQLLGRNYYDPAASKTLNDYKLEMWPGYETSIRQHEREVLLCCDVSTKVLRTDTVLSQITQCYTRDRTNFKSLAEKSLLGAIIITRYNNKTYRIDDICWDDVNVSSTFEKKDGTKIDYKTYYLERYGLKVTDTNQPLLLSMPQLREARGGVSGPIYLVPEFCNMTGLTDEQRSNFQLMKAMADYTRQTPDKRVESLNKFSARINNTPEVKQLLESWNLQFSTALQKFNTRILDPEDIYGKSGFKSTYSVDNADWGNAFRKWQMVSAATCSKWYVIYPPRDESGTMDFVKTLVKVSPSLGFMLANPKYEKLVDNRPASYIQALDRVIAANPTLQMVMVVIPNNKGEHYHAVKKKCCIERPIPSQVMTGTVLGKPKGLMSVATKVAIQMNCKLGGEPWNVAIPLKDTMVMGFDTYHDSVNKGTSVGALVSSTNSTFTKYSSSCIFHKDNTEITMGIKAAVVKALRRYKEANGNIPTRFIFFRDGVGDGQIEYVKDQEVSVIRETLQGAFKENGIETPLKFTYVVVSKRINARFFLEKPGSRPGNPPSGTVVDDVVTLPERYDFFLVSQSVRQGTVNPTSYNVIEDTGGLKPEHLQKLAYKLTHLYYNWPGTVRVPAPCQYAHKLAFLVGQSLHKSPDAKLEDKLFYL